MLASRPRIKTSISSAMPSLLLVASAYSRTKHPGSVMIARASPRPCRICGAAIVSSSGGSIGSAADFVEELRQRGYDFRILSGSCSIDTTTASGRLLFHISAALAENERDVIRERTIAGLASARGRGRKGGRPPKLTAKQVHTARKMLADPEMTIKEVSEVFGVHRATIYRSLRLGAYAKLQEEAVRTDR
jgi:DNA invertase Pin-like site-specific DNA recombinase